MSATFIDALLQSKAPATLDEATTYTPIEKSTFATMLEFNEELIVADLRSTRDFYNGLLESGDYVLNEGVFAAIGGFISNAILTITNTFKYIFTPPGAGKENKSHKQYEASINRTIKAIKFHEEDFTIGYKAHKFNVQKEITVFNRPNGYNVPALNHIMSAQDAQALTGIINEANALCQNMKANQISKEEAKKAIQSLVEREKQLTASIAKFEVSASFTTSKTTVNAAEYISNQYRNITQYSTFIENKKNANKCMSDLKVSDMVANLENFKNSLTGDTGEFDNLANDIRALVVAHTELSKSITNKVNSYCTSMYISLLKESRALLNMIRGLLQVEVPDDESEDDIVDEVAYFENAIDAELATYRWSLMEAYKEGIVKEAVIKANNESDIIYEMQVLNEAISAKAQNAFKNMVAKLKEIFQKFMQKLRNNFTSDRNFIVKYKKIILNNKLPAREYRGHDSVNGMDAILRFRMDTFHYTETLRKNLVDNKTLANYFLSQNRAIPHSRVISFQGDGVPDNVDAQALATYFKEYFGVRTENTYETLQASVIESRMKDIYDFMYDIANIEKMFNKDLAAIDNIEKEAKRQAGIPNTPTTNTAPASSAQPTTATQQTTAESYYSYIDNLNYFLEIEEVQPQTATTSNTQQQTTYNDMTGRVANSANQFTGNNPVNTANGKAQYGTSGADIDQLTKDCQVYSTVVSTIIKSKLTALEAIRSDFKWLFNSMVSHYIGGTAQAANRTAANTNDFIGMQNQNKQ